MKVHTTRTGSRESGVADEGFTTFRVKPWRTIQLWWVRGNDIFLTILACWRNNFIRSVDNVADVLNQLGIRRIRKGEGLLWTGFAVRLDIVSTHIRLNGFRLA